MSKSRDLTALFIVLALGAFWAFAQEPKNDGKNNIAPTVARVDLPPGEAATLPNAVARYLVRTLLLSSSTTSGFRSVHEWTLKLSATDLKFDYRSTWNDHTIHLVFTNLEYVAVKPSKTRFRVSWPKAAKMPESYLLWKKESDALRFGDALNRLIYDAKHPGVISDDSVTFSSLVKKWREDPSSRPKPRTDWEKYRVIAEQAFNDKDLLKALLSYEQGSQANPLWAEGWFNAALLYAELEDFASAADRMKHYLELAPDAPDAKSARDKVFTWEDKTKAKVN